MKFLVGRKKIVTQINKEDLAKFSVKGNSFNVHHTGYVRVITHTGMQNGKSTYKEQRLHRAILNAPKNMQVDHINGDTLDNRKSNLRLCTSSQNNMNSRPKTKKHMKGVYWFKGRNKWIAQITYNKKCHYIGCFETEIDAATAYDREALKFFGEFARVNLPASARR